VNIFVYADESGVFDKAHNQVFVFGGLILLGKDEKDTARRRYISAERVQRKAGAGSGHQELKAIYLSNKQKASMFRAMNPYRRFGVIVRQTRVLDEIFDDRKSKQRYLDYVFKRGLKAALIELIDDGCIQKDGVESIYVFMDEHTTATNGRYEMQEGPENEFKRGTFNQQWNTFWPPLFPAMKSVEFCLRDSCQDALIRAADITANRLYYAAVHGRDDMSDSISYMTLP
jgi:hypothetical protein